MKFIKIVYFDESSVTDFMQIIAGGILKKTTEFITNIGNEVEGKVSAEAGIGTETKGLAKFFSYLSGAKFNVSAKAEASANYSQDRIAKNILENTLLADFIDLIKSDNKRAAKNKRCAGVKIFDNLCVFPLLNSFSFLRLAAPFFTMVDGNFDIPSDDGNILTLNISKIEDAISKGRGYYEFIALYEDKEIILRFNNSAFRNNYTMSDLPKMLLTFHAVYVGKVEKSKLQIEKEFEFGTNNLTRADYSQLSQTERINNDELDVYDVLLAGVVEKK